MIINKRVVEVALSASPNFGKNYKLTGDTFGFGVLERGIAFFIKMGITRKYSSIERMAIVRRVLFFFNRIV